MYKLKYRFKLSILKLLICILFLLFLISCSNRLLKEQTKDYDNVSKIGDTKLNLGVWKRIAYVSNVSELEFSKCTNIDIPENNYTYVKINETTRKVIEGHTIPKVMSKSICVTDFDTTKTTKIYDVIDKLSCVETCVNYACNQFNVGNITFSFLYAEYIFNHKSCKCACTSLNTSKIVNILE